MTTAVTVVRDRFVKGGAADGAITAPLGAALLRRYRGDAHFQQCTSPLGVRLTSHHVVATEILVPVLAFDLDGPGHQATDAWRAETREKIGALFRAHPDGFYYETKGGGRVVYQLPEPFEVATADDADEWKRLYVIRAAYLSRFGLDADRACAEWQRLFRLPHSTRTPGGKPEALPTIGDARSIGPLELPAPAATPPTTPPARRGERSEPQGAGVTAPLGALFDALNVAGLVVRRHDDRSFVIVCPRNHLHSVGTPGDSSTLYYAPNAFAGPGIVHCKHQACSAMRTARQWRRAIAALGDASPTRSLRSRLAGDVGA